MSEANEAKEIPFVGLIVFTPTCELRWNYSNPDRRILEQKWIEHGTGKIEWRAIPSVVDSQEVAKQ